MSEAVTLFGQVAEILGAEATQKLILRRGGTEMKISGRATGPFAKIVGAAAAKAVVDQIGAVKITIPMATARGQKGRRAMVARLLAQGGKLSATALTADVHERTVRRVRERLKDNSLPLFPDDPDRD